MSTWQTPGGSESTGAGECRRGSSCEDEMVASLDAADGERLEAPRHSLLTTSGSRTTCDCTLPGASADPQTARGKLLPAPILGFLLRRPGPGWPGASAHCLCNGVRFPWPPDATGPWPVRGGRAAHPVV